MQTRSITLVALVATLLGTSFTVDAQRHWRRRWHRQPQIVVMPPPPPPVIVAPYGPSYCPGYGPGMLLPPPPPQVVYVPVYPRHHRRHHRW